MITWRELYYDRRKRLEKESDKVAEYLRILDDAGGEFQHYGFDNVIWFLIKPIKFVTKDETPGTILYTDAQVKEKFKDSEILIKACRTKDSEGVIFKCNDIWKYVDISSIILDIIYGNNKTVGGYKELIDAYMTIYEIYQPWANAKYRELRG